MDWEHVEFDVGVTQSVCVALLYSKHRYSLNSKHHFHIESSRLEIKAMELHMLDRNALDIRCLVTTIPNHNLHLDPHIHTVHWLDRLAVRSNLLVKTEMKIMRNGGRLK